MLRHCQEALLSPKQVALAAKTKIQRTLTGGCELAAYKGLHAALVVGTVYDQNLGKLMRHKQLINHPDSEIRKQWVGGNEKEQGYKDVLRFIPEHEVPVHKPVTYPRFTAAYRPEKADPHRIQITTRGAKLTYNDKAGIHTVQV